MYVVNYMPIKNQPPILMNKKSCEMGGPFAPPQELLHGPLGISLTDGVSEKLGGRGGSMRASRRFLHARMQTVCPSFHEPVCAYP